MLSTMPLPDQLEQRAQEAAAAETDTETAALERGRAGGGGGGPMPQVARAQEDLRAFNSAMEALLETQGLAGGAGARRRAGGAGPGAARGVAAAPAAPAPAARKRAAAEIGGVGARGGLPGVQKQQGQQQLEGADLLLAAASYGAGLR
jgi:hypothetical protein